MIDLPLEVLLGAHRDTRCAPGPLAGLDAYGCSLYPRPDLVELGSCTASTVSPRGQAAAASALSALRQQGPEAVADAIREALRAQFALPDDTRIALAPSGTDVLFLLLALARSRWGRGWEMVLSGAGELGGGTAQAAAGCHFSSVAPFASRLEPGSALLAGPSRIHALPARDDRGEPCPPERARAALARWAQDRPAGQPLLVHAVHYSKTGLCLPTESDLVALQAAAPGVEVVIDAAQARIGPATLRRYLQRGWPVTLTGSKFFGGPAFCGALLLPPSWQVPFSAEGLAPYFSRLDLPWPATDAAALPSDNTGLLLRWSAACAEMRRLGQLPAARQHEALSAFRAALLEAASETGLPLIPPPPRPPGADPVEQIPSVFCLEAGSAAQARARWLSLLEVRDGLGFHLGQPHRLGDSERWTLRIACGAPLLVQLAEDGPARLRAALRQLGRRWQDLAPAPAPLHHA